MEKLVHQVIKDPAFVADPDDWEQTRAAAVPGGLAKGKERVTLADLTPDESANIPRKALWAALKKGTLKALLARGAVTVGLAGFTKLEPRLKFRDLLVNRDLIESPYNRTITDAFFQPWGTWTRSLWTEDPTT